MRFSPRIGFNLTLMHAPLRAATLRVETKTQCRVSLPRRRDVVFSQPSSRPTAFVDGRASWNAASVGIWS